MSENIRKFPSRNPSAPQSEPAEAWSDAEAFLHSQLWPDEPCSAQAVGNDAASDRALLTGGLTDSIAVRRSTTSARVRKQTVPVVHALQHLCEMMSEILEEASLQSLVLNGAIKPQEAIMLREAVQWLDRKMSPATH